MAIGCVLRVFDNAEGDIRVACTLSPLGDFEERGVRRLPLEVWVNWISNWMTPKSLSYLHMATPHVAGLLTKDLVEAMARQRLAEGPSPLLQLASAPLQLLVMLSLELYGACTQARPIPPIFNPWLTILVVTGGHRISQGCHSQGCTSHGGTYGAFERVAVLQNPRSETKGSRSCSGSDGQCQ